MKDIKFQILYEGKMTQVTSMEWRGDDLLVRILNMKKLHVANPKTLRRFTGLFDKNGVESYQSDVVEDDSGNRYVMEWNEKEAEFYLKLVHGITGFSHLAARLVRDKRVIGNIYQNPELLEIK